MCIHTLAISEGIYLCIHNFAISERIYVCIHTLAISPSPYIESLLYDIAKIIDLLYVCNTYTVLRAHEYVHKIKMAYNREEISY